MAKDKADKPTTSGKSANKQQQVQQNEQQSGIWQDARFQHLVSDPRFKSLSKTQRKVKIDKRFQGMFTDDRFKVTYTVDKYGRKVNKSNADDLRKFYELETSSSEAESDDEKEKAVQDEEQRKEEQAISRDDEKVELSENDELGSDGEEIPKTLKERLLDPNIDYARGEGRLVTDSSSDDESSAAEEDDPELFIEHVWGELDAQAETTDESTHRLAVCNMDWDRIRAEDLLVLFTSFLPAGGSILSVKIYPSEYGKERLAEEEQHGPQELVGLGKKVSGKKADDDSDSEEELVQEQDSDAEEGDDYHMEKLRQYQLNRLRYYYAVVECDSVQTADIVYKECDGLEYESSATRVDLRFIPDDTNFDEDEPTDVCTERPDTNNYQPRQFTTTALQQAKVDLTWDETAVERRELGDKLSSGKLENVSDRDLRKIMAYSSEEDDEEDDEEVEDEMEQQENDIQNGDIEQQVNNTENAKPKKGKKSAEVIDKYKALLAEINEKEAKEKQNKKYEMEFSWKVANSDSEKDQDNDDDEGNNVANQNPKKDLMPLEKVLLKRNEKNKKRKEERRRRKLQARGIDADEAGNSDSDSMPDGIDMNDPYFAEEFANGDYIDPKTKRKAKARKQKEAQQAQADEEELKAKELELLLDDDDELEHQGKQHFSLDKIQKSEQDTKSKKKRRKQLKKSKTAIAEERKQVEDNFQLNVNDERFGAIYKSHLFNIDPTDSHFKKTKGMEQIIHEKLKRRHGSDANDNANAGSNAEQTADALESGVMKRPRKQLENNILVNSLKRKIQMKQQK